MINVGLFRQVVGIELRQQLIQQNIGVIDRLGTEDFYRY
jgi:hypothetical protein